MPTFDLTVALNFIEKGVELGVMNFVPSDGTKSSKKRLIVPFFKLSTYHKKGDIAQIAANLESVTVHVSNY
jgi:hypothetical protein